MSPKEEAKSQQEFAKPSTILNSPPIFTIIILHMIIIFPIYIYIYIHPYIIKLKSFPNYL